MTVGVDAVFAKVIAVVLAALSVALGSVDEARQAPAITSAAEPTPLPPFRGAINPVTATDLPHSYRPGCPVTPAQLRRLDVSYYGFDGAEHLGSIVVAADRAEQLIGVFQALYEQKFPIAAMRPVDEYQGSDDASMAANNTSAFNCRAVTGGSAWSQHSYGTAIDVNPVQNPYVSDGSVQPAAGADYLDRADVRPGMITADDPTVVAFEAAGWTWGGYWTSPTDYQHFSTNGR